MLNSNPAEAREMHTAGELVAPWLPFVPNTAQIKHNHFTKLKMSENGSHAGPAEATPPDDGELPPAHLSAPLNAELSLGLLHEVNNTMTGLYFTVETMLEVSELPPEPLASLTEVLEKLKVAQRQLNRLGDLQLGLREKTYHEARALVSAQVDLLPCIFTKQAEVQLQFCEEALYLHIDEAGFRKLFLEAAYWLRGKVEHVSKLAIQVEEATHPAQSRPGVALSFSLEGAAIASLEGLPSAEDCGGAFSFQPASKGQAAKLTLFLPQVELNLD